MKISGINHINITVTADKLADVVAFYEQVLGLKKGQRAISRRDGAWLYCGAQPIIHVSVVEQAPYAGADTIFNHVALTCTDVDACLLTMARYNIPYQLDFRSPPEMTQVNVIDPAGIKIELNFTGEKPSNSTH
ncbi:MAG: VOC family protein [Methylovulum sp.]|jgi:catechol-2,3-dioxygenase|nr:VOC family protein [Methylovulum sp.]MCF7998387.1 VOC family protein [Methylovulum sp.]